MDGWVDELKSREELEAAARLLARLVRGVCLTWTVEVDASQQQRVITEDKQGQVEIASRSLKNK